MEPVSLDQQLEAVLFYKAAPVKRAALIKLLETDEVALTNAVDVLTERLTYGALTLIATETELTLVTRPEVSGLIEQLRRDDMSRDIGKAGAETLAIVLYRGPVTRGEIDRIRGVNSSYIIRNLMVRGLIEKGSSKKRVEYQTTTTLLEHLGVTDKKALPDYETILNTLATYEAQATEASVS